MLVFHLVGNLEHGFCDRETWIEKGHGPTLMEFTDSSPHASETLGIISWQSGKALYSRCGVSAIRQLQMACNSGVKEALDFQMDVYKDIQSLVDRCHDEAVPPGLPSWFCQ